jgi:hypothetical protein
MGYVIVAILVILIVAAAVIFFVRGATRRSNVSEAGDPRAIASPDSESPVGSTSEHAEPEHAGTETETGTAHHDRPDVARPVDGGEAEARRSI